MENEKNEDIVDYLRNNRLSQAHSALSHVNILPNLRSTPTTSSSLKSIIRSKFINPEHARNFHTTHYGTANNNNYQDYMGAGGLKVSKKALKRMIIAKNRSQAVRTS